MMLVFKIMGNMTASIDLMKKRKKTVSLTTPASRVVAMAMSVVYYVVKSVCLTIFGADMTFPGLVTQVLPLTILSYARIRERAHIMQPGVDHFCPPPSLRNQHNHEPNPKIITQYVN